MARPYTVQFIQSPFVGVNALTNYNLPGVIANLQPVIGGQPLILNQLPFNTIPSIPLTQEKILAQEFSPTISQPLPPGSSCVIPGGSRSIVIAGTSQSLSGATFTINGLDQFGNPLSMNHAGPSVGGFVEFTSDYTYQPAVDTWSLYFSQVNEIVPNSTVANGFVWACLGGFGMTPFISIDTYRIAWKGSFDVLVPDAANFGGNDGNWNFYVFGTNYPIYTPAPGGQWAPINSTSPQIAKHFIGTNPYDGTPVWQEISAPTAYIWAEVGYFNATEVTQTLQSNFILNYVQQGA